MPLKPLFGSYSLSVRTHFPSQAGFLHGMIPLLWLMIPLQDSSISLPNVYMIPVLVEWQKLSLVITS